jgi:hypothetical protein
VVQYIAGNPWPRQPPFNEIGVYQRTLSSTEWTEFSRRIEVAYEHRSKDVENRHLDAGVESIFAWLDKELWRVAWNPKAPPSTYTPLIDDVRELIKGLRQHPLSVLHVVLVIENGELRLQFSNRGKLPFVFYGFGNKSLNERAELRLQFQGGEELKLSNFLSPIQLLRQPPLFSNRLVEPTKEEIFLGSGESLAVSVERLRAVLRPMPGVLYGLVHLFWRSGGLAQQTTTEEGWLMPPPLEVLGDLKD